MGRIVSAHFLLTFIHHKTYNSKIKIIIYGASTLMKIENELQLDFKHVLIKPKRSSLTSRSQVDLNREFTFLHSGKTWQGVPIVAANMDTVGTYDMAMELKKHNMGVALHKHYEIDSLVDKFTNQFNNNDLVFYSMGVSDDETEKLKYFTSKMNKNPNFLCIDVANGYSDKFVDHVARMRDQYPDTTIMAGNVVTDDIVYELISKGADIVKVGIGPGSVCTTRVKTGVGYPQLSAIIECADAAHQLKGHICSDGGCTIPGDIAKAFGANADFVMIGGMFSGHDESGGNVINRDGKKYVEFYGMSSSTAMNKHAGGVANYRASEGKCVEVPYRGPVENTVLDMLGGLRSTCTYVGARKLKHLSKHTTFIRVEQQENTIFGKENS